MCHWPWRKDTELRERYFTSKIAVRAGLEAVEETGKLIARADAAKGPPTLKPAPAAAGAGRRGGRLATGVE